MESGRDSLSLTWRPYVAGNGAVERAGDILSFVTKNTSTRQYTDAQVDDYQGLPRRRFRWRPPVTLTVRARFSHPAGSLCGTAGFGFWNDPFMMTGARMPALPRAIWFFYASAPSDMRLDRHTPGCGWKAATIDASRPQALALAPLAPFAVLLMNSPLLYHRLWPVVQRALAVREASLTVDMTEWHLYAIEWGVEHVHFGLDGECVLRDAPSPRGPLGFVMWLDNQYMVVTPQGRLGWGLLDVVGTQQMQADRIEISALL
jgi:hypothetical protein